MKGTVAIVVTRYRRGGSERRILGLVRDLVARGGRVVVLVGGESLPLELEQLEAAGGEVVVIGPLVRRISPLADLRAALALARSLRRLRPSLVVAVQQKAAFIARLVAPAGPRFVQQVVMDPFAGLHPALRLVVRAMEGIRQRRVDRWVFVSDELRRNYLAMLRSAPGGRTTVIRSPMGDAMVDRAAEDAPRRGGNGIVVGFVGTNEPRKGFPLLADAVRRCNDAGLDVELRVAGIDASDSDVVDPAIRYEGYVSDIASFLGEVDAVVAPSRSEGLSQVLVQGALLGRPLIGSLSSGLLELAPVGASIVPVGLDPAGIADAIQLVPGLPPSRLDPAFASEFRSAEISARWLELVDELEAACPR